MNDTAKEVQKAKISLLLKERFFGSLITYLEIKPDKSIPTFCTDGKNIRYSPEFAQKCSRPEIVGVLAHEVMHCVFKHHLYRGGRDPKVWNEAGDYVINKILLDSKFTLPGSPLVDRRFDGMNTVQVYNILIQEKPPEESGSAFGEVEDSPDIQKGNQEGVTKEEQVWTQRATQAMISSKIAGEELGALGRAISELLEPKVSWREVLWQVVQQAAKEDYSFMRPNRKYFGGGICLPSLYSEKISSIVVAVDTSGSIGQEDINQFATEIMDIQAAMNTDIQVVYCDWDVQSSQEFFPGDDIKLEPKGGGGTRFSPVFKWVEEKEICPSCLIYLTDGHCRDFPAEEPEYPTLWVTDRKHWTVPFGTIVEF